MIVTDNQVAVTDNHKTLTELQMIVTNDLLIEKEIKMITQDQHRIVSEGLVKM